MLVIYGVKIGHPDTAYRTNTFCTEIFRDGIYYNTVFIPIKAVNSSSFSSFKNQNRNIQNVYPNQFEYQNFCNSIQYTKQMPHVVVAGKAGACKWAC